MRSLQLSEARVRFDLLRVTSYDVTLDLTTDEKTFSSRCVIGFESEAGPTFLDVKPAVLHAAVLDGRPLDAGLLHDGRLPLELTAGGHRLVVEATMPFRNDGEGLHRSLDPADGKVYIYGMSFLDAAPTVFGCFDQPDLKAPYTFHVTAPVGWTVRANALGEQVEPGRWEFETTQPLATYFVTLLAGPYHVLADEHDGIPLEVSSRAALATHLEDQADELLTVTKQCFDEFHRLFGVRYPFGGYHQAFVPDFNAGAMENPGLVTFRDQLIFTSRTTRNQHINRATTISHEMAHQWFGNLVTLKWWDDLWLNESFAEYMGYRAAVAATEFDDALVQNANVRKFWGLTADSRPSTHPIAGNGAVDAASALQDFDGISYAKGSAALRQLASRLGDDVFLGGVREHFELRRFGNATMQDLFTCWEDAGAGDLTSWTDDWLRTSGMDRLALDREAGVVRRTPPEGHAVRRSHALHVATWDGTTWQSGPLVVDGDETALSLGGAPALLDPREETWAELAIDPATVAALPDKVGSMTDPLMRAALWNAVRNAVHHARLSPADALDIVCAGLPVEDQDSAVTALTGWGTHTLLALVDDPVSAAQRLHTAFRAALAVTDPSSGLALAATQGAVATSSDRDELQVWLSGSPIRGVPDAPPADLDLSWRIVRRLTQLGSTDRGLLDSRLADEPRVESRVHHAWCVAALATEDAKAWAWRRFTGEEDAPNHELYAIGSGFWQGGQDALLAPYVGRFFGEVSATAGVRQGWVLGEATRAFFPITALDESTEAAAHTAMADPGLDLTLRRALVDSADELSRRILVRRTYAAAYRGGRP